MARILLVTQGSLARELVRGAGIIAGDSDRLETLSLDWDESPEESERKLAEALGPAGGGDQDDVLILTDLPGGTPYNLARKFVVPDRVELLSGVNLAMLVRLCCPGYEGRSVGELAAWLRERGLQSINRAEAVSNDSEDAATPPVSEVLKGG